MNKEERINLIIDYEAGELTFKETLRLFSDLIKSGLAYSLQGHYGRTAKALIDEGYLTEEGKILSKNE